MKVAESPVPDVERVSALLAGLTADEPTTLIVEGEPKSKARHRFNRKTGHAYTDKKQLAAERALGAIAQQAFAQPCDGNLALACLFFRSSRHRIDVDNLLKHVCDAVNKICWHDDSQVTALLGVLELDAEYPRTVIALAPHSSSLSRSDAAVLSECPTCHKTFTWTPYPSRPVQTYCSRACASRSRGANLSALAHCRHCGQPFRRKQASRIFCSQDCRLAALHENNRVHDKAKTCQICGAQVSRPEYRRCRKCWLDGHREADPPETIS